MGLLSEIQASLLDEGANLGRTLLKIKFLASRIGSDVLEDWVGHEIEGYPKDVPVPEYRKTGLIYTCSLANVAYIRHTAPIPPFLISKHAADHWLSHEFREGMDIIDDTVARADGNTQYSVDASNLMLALQGKIYEGHSILSINGTFDLRAFVRVQSAVRAKLLDLTIRLEKDVPASKEITMTEKANALPAEAVAAANTATASVIYNVNGPMTQITNSGQAGAITLNIAGGDIESLISDLVASGIPKEDAKELAEIMKDEKPESAQQPFGKRALQWMGDKAGKAWNLVGPVGTTLLSKAALKYYGLDTPGA